MSDINRNIPTTWRRARGDKTYNLFHLLAEPRGMIQFQVSCPQTRAREVLQTHAHIWKGGEKSGRQDILLIWFNCRTPWHNTVPGVTPTDTCPWGSSDKWVSARTGVTETANEVSKPRWRPATVLKFHLPLSVHLKHALTKHYLCVWRKLHWFLHCHRN